MDKQLWVLAGGNGVGKSTFYHTQLEPLGIPFVNADIVARQLYGDDAKVHSYDAAKIVEQMRMRLLQEGHSFCFETVFSHPSKIDFIARAKTMGYEIVLVMIHLTDENLNLARVAQRVKAGGHCVPDEKVTARLPRVMQMIKQAIPLCDQVYLLDNSMADDPFQQVAVLANGILIKQLESLPEWVKLLLAD